jgi:uroporphyrinogen-III decarboxylase
MTDALKKQRHIPWSVGIPPEVTTEYVGVKLGEYYRNPEVMLKTQLQAREIFYRLYGLPKGGVGPTYSSYVEASQLGVEVTFPEDNVPMVEKPVMREARDVYRLKILDPYREGLMAKAIRTYEYMKRQVDENIPVGLGGTEGPITTAVMVRGQDFFVDIFLHPKEMHKLLELVTEASLLIRRTIEKVTGRKIRSTGIADDFSGMLSPEQYEEFAFPYQKRIYQEFGIEGRRLHSELLRREHLKFLPKLGVTHYDPGCDQYLEVRDLVEEIPQIPFSFNLKTSQDMMQGTPESIRAKYVQAVEEGAPEMYTEICRGTPRENVQAFIEVAREYE